jgi:hypothetical protein
MEREKRIFPGHLWRPAHFATFPFFNTAPKLPATLDGDSYIEFVNLSGAHLFHKDIMMCIEEICLTLVWTIWKQRNKWSWKFKMNYEDCIKFWDHRHLEDQTLEASDSKSIKWRLDSGGIRLWEHYTLEDQTLKRQEGSKEVCPWRKKKEKKVVTNGTIINCFANLKEQIHFTQSVHLISKRFPTVDSSFSTDRIDMLFFFNDCIFISYIRNEARRRIHIHKSHQTLNIEIAETLLHSKAINTWISNQLMYPRNLKFISWACEYTFDDISSV